MDWQIVTDSSCDIVPAPSADGLVRHVSVPFVLSVGDQDFVDDETLNTADLINAMESCKQASRSSCPAPQAWLEHFKQAERTIALTISSNLSGSLNSAQAARHLALEKDASRQIAVVDSLSTGPEMTLCVEKIRELIGAGSSFEHVIAEAEEFLRRTHIAFALCSFDNLVKNGRMGKVAGLMAKKLQMWGIGIGTDEGTIAIKAKTRGSAKAVKLLIEDMAERGFAGGKVAISHCHNLALAEKLRDGIKELWNTADVGILPTRGLCSYYAERGGLIVSFTEG